MKPSDSLAGGQPTDPKAPVRPAKKAAPRKAPAAAQQTKPKPTPRLKPPSELAPPPFHVDALLEAHTMLKAAGQIMHSVAIAQCDEGERRSLLGWSRQMYDQAKRLRQQTRPPAEAWAGKPSKVAPGSEAFEGILSMLSEVAWMSGGPSNDNRLAMLSMQLSHVYEVARRSTLAGATLKASRDGRSLTVTLPKMAKPKRAV